MLVSASVCESMHLRVEVQVREWQSIGQHMSRCLRDCECENGSVNENASKCVKLSVCLNCIKVSVCLRLQLREGKCVSVHKCMRVKVSM